MELPEPLKPWRTWLDWFSPVLAPELGRLVQQLSPLLGPVRGTRQAGPAEPEGLSDLRRRGPYERLLGSEWLLAEELPDEFLRRAASGEHLFLAPRPRARRAAPLIVALFDAGPLQLGAPRLAHLALWILLARRAQQAGGTLRWGVLQGPGRLNEAATLQDLLLLVRSRSFAPATPLEEWHTWLAEQAIVPGEFWHVGDAPPLGRVSHAVTIRRTIGAEALDVALHQGSGRRTAQLALPKGYAGERLLKGEFQETTTASQAHQTLLATLTLLHPPVWGPGGRDLVVPVLGEPELHVFHIPASPQKRAAPRVLMLPPRGQPLSLAFHGKAVGALIATPSELHFWQMGCPPVPRPMPETFRITAGRRYWLPSAWVKRRHSSHLYAIDEAQRLVRWTLDDKTGRLTEQPGSRHPVAAPVLGLAMAGASAVAYVSIGSTDALLSVTQGDRPGRVYRLGPIAKPIAAHVAGGIDWSKRFIACAVQSAVEEGSGESWVLFHNPTRSDMRLADSVTIALPLSYTGIGVIPRADGRGHALLALAPNRRGLLAFDGAAVPSALYVSDTRIQNLAVDGESGMVALVTEKRELIVYSTRERAVRLFLHGKAGAADAT